VKKLLYGIRILITVIRSALSGDRSVRSKSTCLSCFFNFHCNIITPSISPKCPLPLGWFTESLFTFSVRLFQMLETVFCDDLVPKLRVVWKCTQTNIYSSRVSYAIKSTLSHCSTCSLTAESQLKSDLLRPFFRSVHCLDLTMWTLDIW
jgi:hypothetical protein